MSSNRPTILSPDIDIVAYALDRQKPKEESFFWGMALEFEIPGMTTDEVYEYLKYCYEMHLVNQADGEPQ